MAANPIEIVTNRLYFTNVPQDGRSRYGSNSIIKFADDSTVIGLISDNDESDYREQVKHLAVWCADNNLLLNTSKTKELIVDFRKENPTHESIHIIGTAVEWVSSFKFPGTHICENLSWSTNISSLVKKAHQRLFFFRTLKKNHPSADLLVDFYNLPLYTDDRYKVWHTTYLTMIIFCLLGPLCSICVNRFGCRPVMMVGGLFASFGMVCASFCTNIIAIYFTAGVVTGLGLALNFQPSLIMLNRYFDKRRPLANGLAAAGSPVFLCALSPLGQILQHEFGWRGGFLILGGLLLNCCACGALMRPPNKQKEETKEVVKPKPKKLLDFSVFKDRGFVIYTIAASIMVLGLFVPPVFVVSYAKDLGNEDTKASFLLSILGFIDIFARPTCGIIAGLKWVRPRCVYLLGFAMIFNGFTDLMGSMADTYAGLVVFCIFFGISYGMVGALQFEVLMAIVGTHKFSSAIGLVLLAEAIAVLIGPPSAGKHRKGHFLVFPIPSLRKCKQHQCYIARELIIHRDL
ncbi:monocarboxylate transporter 4-like [Bufo gargarizans]|uniref:monocarboxylate transporter 4-like n=1 Tax=Bufo gargarizans TaxID=30331 RepID=UPI001CF511E1|nr:monocarboxylate transporter 4-like [Bufo gargarizans]